MIDASVMSEGMRKREAADAGQISTRIVERYLPFFDRPEARLRFLNKTLAQQGARQQRLDHLLRHFSSIRESGVYRWLMTLGLYCLILEELRKELPRTSESRRQILQQIKTSPSSWLFFRLYQARHLAYGVVVVAAAATLFGLYSLASVTARRANTYLARGGGAHAEAPAPADVGRNNSQYTVYAATGADFLPDYKPEKVWLVEQRDNYERYSNGARILTDFETDNHARGYYVLPRGAGAFETELRREPVGIVYHTSEGDLLPFTPDNNDSIEARSRRLLEFVRKNRSYNYVIDRFGQIYRIVRDDQAANHAGHSVWADARSTYVGLNESFIGVSFETRSDVGAGEEQLTEAQLIAGRLLTAILRSRHQIDDANCTAHGLVSVNPANMLIGYHRDWARDFPFGAMGLSDKYQVPPASVSEFGFVSDGSVVWPGVAAAEEEFRRRAAESGAKPEEARRRLRERYREYMSLARQLQGGAQAGE